MKPPKTIVISMVTWKQLKKQWRKTLSGSPEKTEFFKLGVENFNFLNYEKFLAVFLLSIFELWMFSFLKYEISFLGSLFLKHKNIRNFFRVSVSWSIINFPGMDFLKFFEPGLKSAGFHFRKSKKKFLLRKQKKSFILREYKIFF